MDSDFRPPPSNPETEATLRRQRMVVNRFDYIARELWRGVEDGDIRSFPEMRHALLVAITEHDAWERTALVLSQFR